MEQRIAMLYVDHTGWVFVNSLQMLIKEKEPRQKWLFLLYALKRAYSPFALPCIQLNYADML